MAQSGIPMVGIDYAENMIRICRNKCEQAHISPLPELVEADMRTMDLGRKFPLILVPFRSFLHLHSQQDQIRTLQCLKKHLLQDGTLTIAIFTPNVRILNTWNGKTFRLRECDFYDPNLQCPVQVEQSFRYDTLNQMGYWTIKFYPRRGNRP